MTLTHDQMRAGHSYSVDLAYSNREGEYIICHMRAEYVGKTPDNLRQFRIDRDRPYLAIPDIWIKTIEPAERRAGHDLKVVGS